MLTFHINRAGDTLPKGQKKHLEDAKDELGVNADLILTHFRA
jgi:hypothetical protein